ncbi:MAG: zf-HC2 domain-containing protein [Treponema sp.]|jgi:hypothetical protein|nr:zf-HC2 domain-containing protein [Treponema sp.]
MCPNRQMLSLYYDGELPSPWKEKMEVHLESCPECRALLSGYRRIGEYLQDVPKKAITGEIQNERILAAQERVWKKLSPPTRTQTKAGLRLTGVWRRNVTLPLPVAAAAILVIIVSFAIMGTRSQNQPPPQNVIANTGLGLDDQGMLPIQDMTGVLQYLSSQDYGDFMVIRLPDSRTFSRTGEPALINAADYSRRNVFR